MTLQLKHGELIKIRQARNRIDAKQAAVNEAQIELQRMVRELGYQYGLDGYQYHIEPETGEIVVHPQKHLHQLEDTVNAVAMLEYAEDDWRKER
jgi:hypothetical protein